MTNREKFAEQILNIACSGDAIAVDKVTLEPIACRGTACEECLLNFNSEFCRHGRKRWADSEYVEPSVDWSKVAVDTPILVTYNGIHSWVKRHFAKYENGSVYAWSDGTTSWSSEGSTTAWKLAKLPERSSNGEINK